jgi:hypothetical protein
MGLVLVLAYAARRKAWGSVRRCGAGGPRTIVSWVGALVGTARGRAGTGMGSGSLGDGLGAGVEAARREWGQVRRRGRPKAAMFFGNCDALQSRWAADRGWAWCWRRGGEKEVGAGRCGGGGGGGREARRPRFFLGVRWGLCGFVVGTNCGAAIGMNSGSGVGIGLVLRSWRRRREGSGVGGFGGRGDRRDFLGGWGFGFPALPKKPGSASAGQDRTE